MAFISVVSVIIEHIHKELTQSDFTIMDSADCNYLIHFNEMFLAIFRRNFPEKTYSISKFVAILAKVK